MKRFTAKFLERRMTEHQEWQKRELDRLCAEAAPFLFPRSVTSQPFIHKKVTPEIRNGLGR
jgi:hypothetical protein